MLRFFYFCFSYLFTPRWRLSKKSPPLAQACSLCPIQNSLTRLTSPTSLTCPQNLPVRLALTRWRKLAACAQFKIQNSKFSLLRTAPLPFGVVGELAQPSMSNGGEEP